MMGVNVVPAESLGTDQMLSKNVVIQTLPRLSEHTPEAALDKLPIRQNVISMRHARNHSSSITNAFGPSFTWRAGFDGSLPSLLVNGKKMQAKIEATPMDTMMSYVDVPVPPGKTITVER